MPGIGDPHIHPGLLMPKRAFCALPGTFHQPTEQQIMAALEACIADYPKDREWFIAQGYSTAAMSRKTLTREVLDRLIPDKPAWIEDESGHNAWFNTKAMEAVGVNPRHRGHARGLLQPHGGRRSGRRRIRGRDEPVPRRRCRHSTPRSGRSPS